MSEITTCPFCGAPVTYHGHTMDHFRCGTHGPDIDGEYDVSHACDITTWTRLLREKDEEIERLRRALLCPQCRGSGRVLISQADTEIDCDRCEAARIRREETT